MLTKESCHYSHRIEDIEYRFLLNDPIEVLQWDSAEEIRIHHRMFEPATAPDPPVPTERWLQAVEIRLTALDSFHERTDLYRDPAQARDGLDPSRWRVTQTRYSAYVYFDTQGSTDYVS